MGAYADAGQEARLRREREAAEQHWAARIAWLRPGRGQVVVYAPGTGGERHGKVLACEDARSGGWVALVEWEHPSGQITHDAVGPAAFHVGLVVRA